jgi:hypothetical protein
MRMQTRARIAMEQVIEEAPELVYDTAGELLATKLAELAAVDLGLAVDLDDWLFDVSEQLVEELENA